jgi:hypothetical protein
MFVPAGGRRAGREEDTMLLRLIFILTCAAFEVLGAIMLRQRFKEMGASITPRRTGQRR